jgi:hypothetical protein
MSFLGGIMKSLVNPMSLMQLAMGPAGWASLAMKTIGSAIAQQVIQQLGQKLGLPPAIINMAQTAFAAASGQPGARVQTIAEAVGQLAQEFNLSPTQQGDLERSANFDATKFSEMMTRASDEGKSLANRGKAGKAGKGDWLRVIAEIMGNNMNSKIEEMRGLAVKMDNNKNKIANDLGGKAPKDDTSIAMQTEMSVLTQEFSMMMNSSSNMIKTIGEGLSTMARKN